MSEVTAAQKQVLDDVDRILGMSESAVEQKSAKDSDEIMSVVPFDRVKPKSFVKVGVVQPLKYTAGGHCAKPTVQTSITQFQPKLKVQNASASSKRKATDEKEDSKTTKPKKPRAKRVKKEKPAMRSTDGVVTNDDDGTVTAKKKKKNTRYIDQGADEANSDYDEDAEMMASMKGEEYDSKKSAPSSDDDDDDGATDGGGGGGGAATATKPSDVDLAATCPGKDIRFLVPDVSRAVLTTKDEAQVQFAIKKLREAAAEASTLYDTLKKREEGVKYATGQIEKAEKAMKIKNLQPAHARLIKLGIERDSAMLASFHRDVDRTLKAIDALAVSSKVDQYRSEINEVVQVADDFIAPSGDDEADGDADGEDSTDSDGDVIPGAERPGRPRHVKRDSVNIRAKVNEMAGLICKEWSKEVKSEYHATIKRMLTSLRGDLHKMTDESFGRTDTQFEYAAVIKEGKMCGDYRVIVSCSSDHADLTIVPIVPEINGSPSDRDEWNSYTLITLLGGWGVGGFRSFKNGGLILVNSELEELCWFGMLLIVQYHTIDADVARSANVMAQKARAL